MASLPDDLASPTALGSAAPIPLSGQGLRYALSLELLRSGELTVRALVERIEAAGYRIVGRPSKAVSDVLRWEAGHCRVARIGRGLYRTGRIPRSTVRWMQRSLQKWRARWTEVLSDGQTGDAGRPAAPKDVAAQPASRPSGLTRYRRQRRAQGERAVRLQALGLRPWAVALVPSS